MTRPVLSRESRPELPDPEDERVLSEAERSVFYYLKVSGLGAESARFVMSDLADSELFRLSMRTVCELTPSG